MDVTDQNPVIVPSSVPVQEPTQFKIPEPSSSKFPMGLIVLPLLVLVVGAVIYFGKYYPSSLNIFSKPTPTPTIAAASPSAMPTVDPTANWNTLKFSKYGFTCKIPSGWGIVNNMLTGVFVPINSDKQFDEGFNLIMIKKSSDSKSLIQLDLTRQANPYFEKTGTEPEFDQILSTFKFTEKSANDNLTANWKTYTSPKFTFSIKYPSSINTSKLVGEWTFEEIPGSSTLGGGVGFGPPASKSGGWAWGVYVYGGAEEEKLIAEMGNQFSDRKEERKEITVNGLPATLVTVTTPQIKDWIYKAVFIQVKTPGQSTIYRIGNGAVDLPEFDSFVESFRLTN